MENTFVMIKPDGVKRGLTGIVISRFERAGLALRAMKLLVPDRRTVEEHYAEHRERDFFEPMALFLCSGPVVAMEWSGSAAVENVRKLVGATEPKEAAPGTVRGDFGHTDYADSRAKYGFIPNMIHASDSMESAQRELGIWFADTERVDYMRCDSEHI